MTPERETEIRKYLKGRATLSDEYAIELLAGLDASRAEASMLRDSNALYRDEVSTLIRERDAAHHSLDAARAERDELRGKVALLNEYVHDELNAAMLIRDMGQPFCAAVAFQGLASFARELGLFKD